LQQPSKAEEAVVVLEAILNAKADSVLDKFVYLSGADRSTSTQLSLTANETRCRAAEKLGELGEIDLRPAQEALASFQVEKAQRGQRQLGLLVRTEGTRWVPGGAHPSLAGEDSNT